MDNGVPNPDDGVWFFIDFHTPDSAAQIDTQPSQPPIRSCFGDKRLTFLIWEGKNTKSIGSTLWKILGRHGVKHCP
jgi:hypothetical protein